jgi:predicted protein tyrosine phosphatase
MKLLFVCNQNKHRSITAENLFKHDFETRSAGLYNNHIREADMEWADIVFVMEDFQMQEIAKRFPKQYLMKRILSLEIPDVFLKDNLVLKKLLKQRFEKAMCQIAV